jgi:hypothetical protein
MLKRLHTLPFWQHWHARSPLPAAIVLSLFISLIIFLQIDVINNDGLLYLHTADVYAQSGLKAAIATYEWPFYSVLIAAIAKLLPVSTAVIAFSLNAIFDAITVVTFVAIVRTFGGDTKIQWLAMLIILALPSLNHSREYIVRDHGYYAFYLLALYALLRYSTVPRFKIALGWTSAIVVAALFRSEGILFLTFAPLIFLFQSDKTMAQRLRNVAYLQWLLMVMAVVLAVATVLVPDEMLGYLPRLQQVWQMVISFIANATLLFISKQQIIATQVLDRFSDGFAPYFLMIGLAAYYLISIIATTQVFFFALTIYAACKHKIIMASQQKKILFTFIFINLALTSFFFLDRYFLVHRYTLALALVLLTLAPWGLQALLVFKNDASKTKVVKWILPGLIALFSYLMVDSLILFGHSKQYQRLAGEWVADSLPAHARIYSNLRQVYYYGHIDNPNWEQFTNNPPEASLIYLTPLDQYDYVALQESRDEVQKITRYLSRYHLKPLCVFQSKHGSRVVVYQVIR